MYLIRGVLNCKPGKVRAMIEKFQAAGVAMERLGYAPFRLYTDVSGERFWTLVLESEVEALDDFVAMEAAIMADPEGKEAMAGYHDLLIEGRREIYKIES